MKPLNFAEREHLHVALRQFFIVVVVRLPNLLPLLIKFVADSTFCRSSSQIGVEKQGLIIMAAAAKWDLGIDK